MNTETKILLAKWLAQFTPDFINQALKHQDELLDNEIFVIILTKWCQLKQTYDKEYDDYIMDCLTSDDHEYIPEDAYFWKYTHNDERSYNEVLMNIIYEINRGK